MPETPWLAPTVRNACPKFPNKSIILCLCPASNADPDEDDIDQKFSMKLSECKIPDTLVFEAGSPVAWYKSSSAGAVIRKGMGMLEERLISEFTKPSHFAVGSGKVGEGGPSRNSIGVEVRATWLQFSSKVKKMKKESSASYLFSCVWV